MKFKQWILMTKWKKLHIHYRDLCLYRYFVFGSTGFLRLAIELDKRLDN